MSDDSFSVKCGGEGASLPKWGGGGLSLAMNSSEPNRMLAINAISGAPFNAADVGCGDADIDHRNHHRNRNFESEFASFLATVEWFRLRGVAREVVLRSMVGGGRKGLRWRRAFANDIGCPGGYAVDGLDSKPSIPLLGASMARRKEIRAPPFRRMA